LYGEAETFPVGGSKVVRSGPDTAAGITGIPTLMAFREGVLLFNQAGALPAAALAQVVDAVKDLDMDEVRKDIAAQSNARSDETATEH
jgi:thioredoxin-like negative regulator of GroEL